MSTAEAKRAIMEDLAEYGILHNRDVPRRLPGIEPRVVDDAVRDLQSEGRVIVGLETQALGDEGPLHGVLR